MLNESTCLYLSIFLAASPTKLAEYFAMGIPVISSSGVGDTQKKNKLINGGDIIKH